MLKQSTIVLSIVMVILTGCTMPRQMTLFVGDASTLTMPIPEYQIEPGDVLHITFSAINSEAVAPYNSAGSIFLIDQDGTTEIPVIGKITLAGKSVDDVKEMLTELVRDQVQEPIISLSISNATITFLGEVNRPCVVSAANPITFIEALGNVGGLTKNAKCDDVVVRRSENGMIRQYHINLLNSEIFTSPCYYLQKGDVVYIAPRHAKRY